MKRTLAITAATALLALSLAGCGAERNGDLDLLPDFDGTNANDTTATDTMRNDNAMNGTGTTNGATANAGAANGGLGSVTGAVNRGTQYGSARYGATSGNYAGGSGGYSAAYNGANAYTATNNGGMTAKNGGGASFYGSKEANDRYQLMLENARVHDTDGFLFDGENAHYHTF
ncbi:MAG: hypothetical protein IJV43_07140 [Oscillospiraceae bacterium]|nr:hypothetical protein [Oscillospiraceae bacterium]